MLPVSTLNRLRWDCVQLRKIVLLAVHAEAKHTGLPNRNILFQTFETVHYTLHKNLSRKNNSGTIGGERIGIGTLILIPTDQLQHNRNWNTNLQQIIRSRTVH